MTVKYAFICGEEGNYPIDKMCVWAKVSRSGYYEWHGRGPSPTAWRRRRKQLHQRESALRHEAAEHRRRRSTEPELVPYTPKQQP